MDDYSDSKLKSNPSLTNQTINGINWQFLAAVVQITLSLIVGIVLARLLSPEEFGIVGYVLVFVGFTRTISDAGISPALVQLSNLTAKHLGVGLLAALSIAIIATGLLWFLAPIIVNGISIVILRVISSSFLINVPGLISESLLRRSLKFYPIFIVDTISYSIGYGLVSSILALSHFGVWSLVAGILVQCLIRSILLWIMSPFRISVKFSKNELHSILRFGTGMTLARISNYGANNLDYFVTGTFLGSQALGLYQRSFQLVTTSLISITGVITSVLFPVFSKIQNDLERSQRMYLLSVKTTSLVTFPIAILLALTSSEIIITLYGNKWSGSILPLSILSINASFISILTLGDALARGRGLVFHQFRRHFAYAIMVFAFAFLGSKFSIEGIAIGVTLASFIMYLLMAKLSIGIINARWHDFFVAQIPGIFVASIMGIVTFISGHLVGFYIKSELVLLLFKLLFAGIVIFITFILIPKNWLGEIPHYITIFLYEKFPKSVILRKIMKFYGVKCDVAQ